MEAENVQQQLIDAETKLSRALQRLHALRRAALYGNYDPVEFCLLYTSDAADE